jgi:hypothetical protein
MKTQNTTIEFEAGNIYQMKFIGDSDLKPQYICVKTTGKTATFERFKNPSEVITRKIKVWNGVQYIVDGTYSMAPSIYADKIVG